MRNGNLISKYPFASFQFVLILPMRNGNVSQGTQGIPEVSRSYPTYEEWKPVYTSPFANTIQYVLILPMRNGNLKASEDFLLLQVYRSYPTYEEWKQIFSSSLLI